MDKEAICCCLIGALGSLDVTVLLSTIGESKLSLEHMDDLGIRLGDFSLVFGASIKVLGSLGARSGA